MKNKEAQDDSPMPAERRGRKELHILGITSEGKPFRPSDWAERLCGVMACFRPQGGDATDGHLGYSPYVRPALVNGAKAVIVNDGLREIEPLAYHFVLQFAADNDLKVIECGFT